VPNGVSPTNGKRKADDDLGSVAAGKKRAPPEGVDEIVPSAKREKLTPTETITLDDDGAILIEDD